jgi:hypothetical protein
MFHIINKEIKNEMTNNELDPSHKIKETNIEVRAYWQMGREAV